MDNTATSLTDDALFGDCLPIATDSQLTTITDLIRQSVAIEKQIEEAQTALKLLVEQKRGIDEKTLPDALIAAGMLEFKTDDETKVKVENKVYASISKAREAEAFEWLRGHNHAALIKNEIRVPFERGADAVAVALEAYCKEHNIDFNKIETVHAQTLQAFVREQVAQSKPLPLELFGVHTQTVATIKLAKPKTK